MQRAHTLFLFPALLILLLTTPALAAPPAQTAPIEVMVGQMLMAGFRGLEATPSDQISKDIKKYHLGGVVLFNKDMTWFGTERNIRNKKQVKALISSLQSYAEIPLLVSVDQEGGKVQRLKEKHGFLETPSAKDMCASGELKVRTAAFMTGTTMSSVGFNLDFAPVTDVDVNPDSPAIGRLERSFSSDPQKVARCAELFMEELSRAGVLSCLKHFPGHGSAGTDSHAGVTDVTKTWTEAELIPYRELIKKGEPTMIMTAHIFNAHLDPKHPATLSKAVITDLLRNDLGYDGVVITDDMNMRAITSSYGQKEAIRLAIEAGADILLFGNNLTFDKKIVGKAHGMIMDLVKKGKITRERIEASYERIMRLKATLS